MNSSSEPRKLINAAMSSLGFFVRAQDEDRRWMEGAGTQQEKEEGGGSALSGKEARDFYQSLFAEQEDVEKSKVKKKKKKKEEERRETRSCAGAAGRGARHQAAVLPGEGDEALWRRHGNRLLRCAQEGDVRGVRRLLDAGVDVNFRDGFYWTAVMCAGGAGQAAAVRLLLERGAAWIGVVDTQGRDARDLALQAGHHDVVQELEQFAITDDTHTPADTHSSRPEWCEACEASYTTSSAAHASSVLHQFQLQRPTALPPSYCLPPSSAPYRMMLRCGWDPAHSGLGPAHSGPAHPVPTVLKRDQAGLGFGPPKKPRITHFGAGDARAVHREEEKGTRKERGKTLNAKALRRREERERTWERDFRTSFNINT